MANPRRLPATVAAALAMSALALAGLAGLAGIAAPSYAASSAGTTAGHDHAATALAKGYTYWGYYRWNAKKQTWDYMTVGANDKSALPKDGEVYGLRWALVVKEPRLPRADGDFGAICGDEPAEPGQKRIGLVIDYGNESDAVGDDTTPEARGVCARVDDSYTAQQALQKQLPVRTGNGGLICGIDDYPSQGCGEVVPNAEEPPSDTSVSLQLPADEPTQTSSTDSASSTDTADEDNDGSSVSTPLIVTVVIVVVLIGGAVVLRRRQS